MPGKLSEARKSQVGHLILMARLRQMNHVNRRIELDNIEFRFSEEWGMSREELVAYILEAKQDLDDEVPQEPLPKK
jgi:hypothetical protein